MSLLRQHTTANPGRRYTVRAVVLLGLTLQGVMLLSPSAQAAWPGRNGRISFIARVPNPAADTLPMGFIGDYNVFSVPPGGAGIRQETDSPLAEFQGQWSPDGTKIVYTQVNPIIFLQADIYVVDTRTGETTNVSNSPYMESFPSWSPGGERIIFSSDRADPSASRPGAPADDLYVMDADGGNVQRLTSDPAREMQAVWSPDGEHIVYRNFETGLILIRADGSQPRVLASEVGGGFRGAVTSAFAPQWSPNGTHIAFSTGQFQGTGGDVWVIAIDGTRVRNVTEKSDAANRYPAWSPDGKSIAFVSDRDGSFKLYKMRPDGSHVVKLTDIALEADANPNWGPRP